MNNSFHVYVAWRMEILMVATSLESNRTEIELNILEDFSMLIAREKIAFRIYLCLPYIAMELKWRSWKRKREGNENKHVQWW